MLTCEHLILNHHRLQYDMQFCLLPKALVQLTGGDVNLRRKLLKTLAGIKRHHETVRWNGMPVSPGLRYDGECIQYLGQDMKPCSWRTVEGWLAAQAGRFNAESRVEAALHYMQLNPVRSQRCFTLSATDKRRVALTNLLATPSRIWLLEEPLVGLDMDNAQQIQNLVASLCNQGGIVIFSSNLPLDVSGIQTLNLEDFAIFST